MALSINDPLNAIGKAGQVTMSIAIELQGEMDRPIQVTNLKLNGLPE